MRGAGAARAAVKHVRSIAASPDRHVEDFYRTPPWATEALLRRVRVTGTVWEPACGDGQMASVLGSSKYVTRLLTSDLYHRGYGTSGVDFLQEADRLAFLAENDETWETKDLLSTTIIGQAPIDWIITNPPFMQGMPQKFVETALPIARLGVAIIARLLWLEGKNRQAFFHATPLERVLVFSSRVDIARSGYGWRKNGHGGMVAYAWYVWRRSHVGPPVLEWL